MSGKNRKSEDNAFLLKEKVRELEGEVSKLKQRLDDLRKAKNNTILKREREVIQVGGPNLGRPVGVETSKYNDLQHKFHDAEKKKLEQLKTIEVLQENLEAVKAERDSFKKKCEKLDEEISDLKNSHELQIAELKADSRESKAKADDLWKEVERLREKLELKSLQQETSKVSNNERETYITDLINENTLLREREEKLMNELSEKEVRWLNNENKVSRKIQEKWDEKYAKWMSETEKKIDELRAANLVLKECLARRKENESSSTASPQASQTPDGK